jgi:hypothetical protein
MENDPECSYVIQKWICGFDINLGAVHFIMCRFCFVWVLSVLC